MQNISNSTSIAAIATPNTAGSVAMIRISGDDAFVIVGKVFSPVSASGVNAEDMSGYTAAYGYIHDGGIRIDDGVLLVFRAPKSYTGENVAEITCHGGIYVARRVLQACINAGARIAEAGEFTKRAVLNGKMTLTQAESVIDVINAAGEQYLACANAQKSGALYRAVSETADKILSVSSAVSAAIDYPEEYSDEEGDYSGTGGFEINTGLLRECAAELSRLLESYGTAAVMREGVVTAIVGKPNAGKSTLMNLLSRKTRSIVTDVPGTTRDIVEETVNAGGAILRLCDCAGIRRTDDAVERIGIEYMVRQIEESSLIIAVFDNSRPLGADDLDLIARIKNKICICVINKCDLEARLDDSALRSAFGREVRILRLCAKDPTSLQTLTEAVKSVYNISGFDLSAGFIANERQRNCAVKAKEVLLQAIENAESNAPLDTIGFLLESALDELYRLSGKQAGEEIIDEVFRKFCVGK